MTTISSTCKGIKTYHNELNLHPDQQVKMLHALDLEAKMKIETLSEDVAHSRSRSQNEDLNLE
jgi:hypothetical protein